MSKTIIIQLSTDSIIHLHFPYYFALKTVKCEKDKANAIIVEGNKGNEHYLNSQVLNWDDL